MVVEVFRRFSDDVSSLELSEQELRKTSDANSLSRDGVLTWGSIGTGSWFRHRINRSIVEQKAKRRSQARMGE